MDDVVLLHGLGRTWRSMRPLARALERAGYRAFNVGYPSLRGRLPDLAAIARTRMEQAIERAGAAPESAGTGSTAPPRLHFVGHSLGCILIRYLLARHRPERLGRVVLLTPPNQGARMADRVAPFLSWLMRPLPDLTVSGGVAASIPTPPGVAIGVIAGGWDVTVRQAETRLEGETDRVLVPYGHSFLMLHREVQGLTVRFIRDGRFRSSS